VHPEPAALDPPARRPFGVVSAFFGVLQATGDVMLGQDSPI